MMINNTDHLRSSVNEIFVSVKITITSLNVLLCSNFHTALTTVQYTLCGTLKVTSLVFVEHYLDSLDSKNISTLILSPGKLECNPQSKSDLFLMSL